MKQTSTLTQALTDAQVEAARDRQPAAIVYRLYTETKPNLQQLVSVYFPGATFTQGVGLWHGQTEDSTIIELVAPSNGGRLVRELARTIARHNDQTSVLVISAPVITADYIGKEEQR